MRMLSILLVAHFAMRILFVLCYAQARPYLSADGKRRDTFPIQLHARPVESSTLHATAAAASAGGRHLFHGVWRPVWTGRHRRAGRLRDAPCCCCALSPCYGVCQPLSWSESWLARCLKMAVSTSGSAVLSGASGDFRKHGYRCPPASFDMAIYPALAVAYLGQLNPALTVGHRGVYLVVCCGGVCVAWNLRGAYSVGQGSLWMLALLLTPFLGIVGLGLWSSGLFHLSAHSLQPASLVRTPNGNLVTALLFVVWNYMGWDNASTIAAEVENPQRNYIRSMLAAVLLVVVSYVLPIAVVALDWNSRLHVCYRLLGRYGTNVGHNTFWPGFASWLAFIVVAGGTLTGIAMFNALMLSYARVPAAMASDGLLPKALARRMKNGVPWVAVLVCAGAWALALELNLTRLLELDILLYGLSLVLEFVALAVLRWREPSLPVPSAFLRPLGAVAIGVAPTALVFFTIFAARADHLTRKVTCDSFRSYPRCCGSAILSVHPPPQAVGEQRFGVMQYDRKMMFAMAKFSWRNLRSVQFKSRHLRCPFTTLGAVSKRNEFVSKTLLPTGT